MPKIQQKDFTYDLNCCFIKFWSCTKITLGYVPPNSRSAIVRFFIDYKSLPHL